MDLSRYVVDTFNPSRQRVWFHTITKQELPINASIDELREYFFLPGQEEDAVNYELFRKPFGDILHLFLAPSWECNLRCTHCMVRERLVMRDSSEIDTMGVKDLVQRCVRRYGVRHLPVQFYGGEILLNLAKFVSVMDCLSSLQDVQTTFGLFTNLTMSLTEEHMLMLSRFASIGVSIDGLEKEHNLQRIPKDIADFNPFHTTINNLKLLVKAGLKERIEVQACLRDEFNTPEYRKSFYRLIVQFGIDPRRITVGTLAPSKTNPEPQKMYLQGLKMPKLADKCCCKYRHNVLLMDYHGNVYSDFYTYTRLGSIYDDLSVIENRQKQLILDTMPAIHDPKCRSCNVLGYCWGGCSVIENMQKPLSTYCDQLSMQKLLNDLAQAGTLIQQSKETEHEHI